MVKLIESRFPHIRCGRNPPGGRVAFSSGFTMTALEEAAIVVLPEHAWTAAIG